MCLGIQRVKERGSIYHFSEMITPVTIPPEAENGASSPSK